VNTRANHAKGATHVRKVVNAFPLTKEETIDAP
jgi:hypothetical protein